MKRKLKLQFYAFGIGTLILLLCGAGFFVYALFLNSYEELDSRDLKEDALRVDRAFEEKLSELETKLSDWGSWDEAFSYIYTKDKAFERANFTANVLAGMKVNLVSFLNSNLEPISIKLMTPEHTIVSEDIRNLPFLKPDSYLLRLSEEKSVSGVVEYFGHPAIIALKKISKGDGSGPSSGRVIFLKFIDEPFLRHLSDQTLFEISFETTISASEAGTEGSLSFDTTSKSGKIEIFNDFGIGYIPVNSLDEKSIGFIKVKIPREIAIFGRKSAKGMVAILCLFILAALISILILFRLNAIRKGLATVLASNRELEKSENHLRALLDSVPGYVSWFSSDLRYLGVNKNLATDFGLKPSDFIGKPIGFATDDTDQEVKVELKKFFTENVTSKQTYVYLSKLGERKKFFVCFEKYNNNRSAIVVGIDVTNEWQNELQAAKSREVAITASRLSSLSEMGSGIAHEINNPLAIIQGNCQKLSRMLSDENQPEKYQEPIRAIEATVFRISKIVSGLRSFARDGSKDPFAEASISSIVEDTIFVCSQRLKKNSIDLRLSPMTSDIIVKCRKVQIGQALLNLLNNSVDQVLNLDEKWISISFNSNEKNVEIIVTDSGHGISADIADKIMDPFFTTKPVGKGTGLGLSIASGIVQEHDGTLRYDPLSPNTKFVISLQRPSAAAKAA